MRQMQPRSVSAFEHQVIPIGEGEGLAITLQEAYRLTQISENRPGFCTLGYRSVKLAQYAGIVGLRGRVLEILPKIEGEDSVPENGRGIFLRLLRLSRSVKLFVDEQVQHDLRRQSLLDIFISAYFDAVSAIVRAGLLRRYQASEDDLTLIRGRMLIARQAATHAMRVDRLACRFDELTADNEWNQCLRAALHAVKPWISHIDLRRRWLELSAALEDVSLCSVTQTHLDDLVFDRQAVRYKPAIQWAKWILRVLSPNLRVGQNEAPGMIFDMNQLFESAVVTVLRRRAAACAGMQVSAQEAGSYLAILAGSAGKPAIGLRPDIVVRERGETVAVADTKWSRVNVSPSGYLMPNEAHIYQMQAYAAAYPCEHFTLIYPWHSGLKGSRQTTFELPHIGARRPVVSVACIDVTSDAFVAVSGASDSTVGKLLCNSRLA